jgi:hypothetical protein
MKKEGRTWESKHDLLRGEKEKKQAAAARQEQRAAAGDDKAAERAGLLSELLDTHSERERSSDGAERVLSAEAQRVRSVRLPYR